MDVSNIGSIIRQQRQKLKLSQKELAKMLNVSAQLISKWETGESVPSLEYVDALCKALNITSLQLLGEVAEEKQSGKKTLNQRKLFKNLIISLGSFFGAAFVVGFALLLHFYIIPAANRTKSLQAVEQSISAALENGFYNIMFVSSLDGQIGEELCFQGYFDTSGNVHAKYVCSNNGLPSECEVIADNILSRGTFKFDYSKPAQIVTLFDLFENQLSRLENDNILNFEDIKYIRKTSSGFYFELSKSFITDSFTPADLKNIKVGKVSGNILIENGTFKSMWVATRVKNKLNGEVFEIETACRFKNERPVIEHENLSQKTWSLPSQDLSTDQFLSNLSSGTAEKLTENSTASRLFEEQLFESGNQLCLISEDEITYINPKTLEKTDALRFDEKGKVMDGLTYQNGYIYSVEGETLRLYNDNLTLDKSLTLKTFKDGDNADSGLDSVYVVDGNVFYSYKRSSFWFRFSCCNIATGTCELVAQFNFYQSSLLISFNGNFAYWNATDYSSRSNYGYVYNLQTKNQVRKSGYFIRFTDKKGNSYLTQDKYSYDLYFNSPSNRLEKTGTFEESDNFVLVNYYNQTWFKYADGVLIETINSVKNNQTFQFGNFSYTMGDGTLQNTQTQTSTAVGEVVLAEQIFKNMKIVGHFDNKLLVTTYISAYDKTASRLAYYTPEDLTRPVQFISVQDVLTVNLKESILVLIKQAQGISCFLLVHQ